jgi:hypothetical protein
MVVQTKIKDRAEMRLVVDIGCVFEGNLSAGEEISIAERGPVVNLLSIYFVTQSTSYNQIPASSSSFFKGYRQIVSGSRLAAAEQVPHPCAALRGFGMVGL